ncbi:MAG: nucleotidyltransferase domain-containing protein [Desulfobacterales bacterium]|nr:MAG: nucleotidyltransferase domain-containing protein [Desulfobacterales bacterium]
MKESSTHRHWEITPDKVESAIRKIIEVGRPRKIILFGSYLRNKTHAHSDVDFLIVAGDDIENPRKESVRIRRALRGISMPMDIIVVPETAWIQLKDQPGLIYHEASRKGRVVYES